MKADLLAVGFTGDLIYPSDVIREMVDVHRTVNDHSAFFEVDTRYGHDGFLVEFEKWGDKIKAWLDGCSLNSSHSI
jgi:homoserine O-acetyltransferase